MRYAGWLGRVMRSSHDNAVFAALWRDLDSLVGDLSSHLALNNRAGMQRLLAARQPAFDDETAALRRQVDALGGVEAVTSDIKKMQQVRSAATPLNKASRPSNASCKLPRQALLLPLATASSASRLSRFSLYVLTEAVLLFTLATLQVAHAMGVSDQLMMAELQQTRADADHGPLKLIPHPIMHTMWHDFLSSERVGCTTFWAAFPECLPQDARHMLTPLLQHEGARDILMEVILRQRSVIIKSHWHC